MKLNRKIIKIAVAALCLVLIVILFLRGNQYNNAIKLMEEGRFKEASAEFRALGKFLSSEAYLDYCTAHIYASNGEYSRAEYALKQIEENNRFNEYTRPAGFQEFCEDVKKQADIARQEREEREAAQYRERVRTGVPFVGMYESDIGKTTLGFPNGEPMKDFEIARRVPATVYRWVRDGYVVFSARCAYGTVQEVWDNRANPWQKVPSGGSSTGKRRTSSGGEADDPLNAKSYRNPEDFYDDNYYDFFDYESAEDYYYDHGGR